MRKTVLSDKTVNKVQGEYMPGPFGPPPGGPGGPPPDPFGTDVGSRRMYPDLQGNLHPTPGGAINSNQRIESDYSRGASGGCNQDPRNVPNPGR